MDNRRAKSSAHGLSAVFSLGVVTGMSDEQLLERFAAQSEADRQIAFEAIVQRHGPMVLGVCRRVLRDEHDAEDAFQATFMVLALRAGMVRKRKSLGPWLHGVAARIAYRASLVIRRRKEQPIPADGLAGRDGRDPALADLEQVVDEEITRLPDKYRLPVVLCCLEGRTQEEAAQQLGWTKGTVSGRLARAKGLLEHRLLRRGLAPSVGLLAVSLAPPSASAAVRGALLSSTVRVATLASFAGAKTGLVTVEVASMVREALKRMALGRIAKAAALLVLCGFGATAIATQVLGPARRAAQGNADVSAVASDGSTNRPGTAERRHNARLVGVAFSASDQAAVTAQADGLARFWDPVTGRAVRMIDVTSSSPGGHRSIRQFTISPDGRYLGAAGFVWDRPATQAVGTIWIWSALEPRRLRTIDANFIDLQCLAFSPDGAAIATGEYAGLVKLWDIATGDCVKTATLVANQSVFSLTFADNGETLATIEQGKGVKLWDLSRGDITLIPIPLIGGTIAYFSGDGRFVAVSAFDEDAGNWGRSMIWDRTRGQKHLTVHGAVQGFAPDSVSLVVVTSEGMLAIVSTETGEKVWKADLGPSRQPAGVAFSPDGKTLIVGWENVLRFFDAETGRERFVSRDPLPGTMALEVGSIGMHRVETLN